MDLAPPAPPAAQQPSEGRASPSLTLELSSNNPFRNRAASPLAASPGLESPRSIHSAPPNRPVSRNPFLSPVEQENPQVAQGAAGPSKLIEMEPSKSDSTNKESPRKNSFGKEAEELFKGLSLGEPGRKGSLGDIPSRPPPPYRAGTGPPHRPSHSQEDGPRRPRPRGPPGERRRDSPDKVERRPRRNSDSSMMDKGPLTEEERKRRDQRRREREKAKGDKPRDGRSHKSRRPGYIDLIDKMDVTGLYGSGLFHHDGPFDAVNPHRNRKKDNRAPMQAFPANSANMALGGSGPVNKNLDLERIHGTGAEGFTDYNSGSNQEYEFRKRPSVDRQFSFDPKARVEMLHGEESLGLGTSTFLEGAPASRKDIQRQTTETEQAAMDGGLSRKKSLAQRIRGISQPRRFGDPPRITSPEARYGPRAYGPRSPDYAAGSSTTPTSAIPKAQSAGGMTKADELNPFFNEYDDAYEKKGTTIKIAEEQKVGHVRTPSSPDGPALERRVTSDGVEDREQKASFLSRVKSLKGGKRRVERPAP